MLHLWHLQFKPKNTLGPLMDNKWTRQLSHILHCYNLRSLFILSREQSLLWPRQECWIWMDCCHPPASQSSNICHRASQSFQTEIQRKQTCKTAIYVDWLICFPRGIQSRGTDNANNVLQTTLPMPGRKGHVTEYQKQLKNRTVSQVFIEIN